MKETRPRCPQEFIKRDLWWLCACNYLLLACPGPVIKGDSYMKKVLTQTSHLPNLYYLPMKKGVSVAPWKQTPPLLQ